MKIKSLIIFLLVTILCTFGCDSKKVNSSVKLNTTSELSSTNETSSTNELFTSNELSTTSDTFDSQKNSVDDDGNPYKYLSSIDELFEQGKNYEIYSDKVHTGFHYYVKDNDGNVIDEGYHNWRGSCDFSEKDGILELEYGFGGPLWQKRYYDVSNGRVSRFFPKPLQTSGELVAYFKTKGENLDIILVIQNMFDPSKYYKEINRDFSIFVITGQCTAEFVNDNKQLKITYWINPNDKEITETIDLG